MTFSLWIVVQFLSVASAVLLRPHIGVKFDDPVDLVITNNQWYLTIASPLPEYTFVKENGAYCQIQQTNATLAEAAVADEMCQIFNNGRGLVRKMSQDLHSLYREQQKRINYLLGPEDSDDLTWQEETPADNGTEFGERQKREAWFGLGGRILNKVLGVARDEDIQVLRRHMGQRLNNLESRVLYQGGQLNSIIKVDNERVDTLWKAVNISSAEIQSQEKRLNKLETRFKALENIVLSSAQEQMALQALEISSVQVAQIVVEQTDTLIVAVQQLQKGYLSDYFLNPQDLDLILHSVKEHLQEEFPMYELAYSSPYHYYTTRYATGQRKDKHLYITLRIPLVDTTLSYLMYPVKAIPIPVDADHSHLVTKVSVQPYLAVSKDLQYFVELSTDDMLACTAGIVRRCDTLLPINRRHQLTCTAAIFFDVKDSIAEQCSHTVSQKNDTYVYILDTHKGSVLVSTNDFQRWSKNCFKMPPVDQTGCPLCTVTQDCRCSLHGRSFYLPPKLSLCGRNATSMTVIHHANFAVSVLTGAVQRTMNKNVTFDFSTPVTLATGKSMKLIQTLNRLFQKDKSLKLDLNTVLSGTDNPRLELSQSGNYPLEPMPWYLRDDRIIHGVSGVTMFIVFSVVVMVLYLFREVTKVKKALALVVLANPGAVSAVVLKEMGSQLPMNTLDPPTCENIFVHDITVLLLAVVITFLLLFFICLVFGYCIRRQNKYPKYYQPSVKVYLRLATAGGSYAIYLEKLPASGQDLVLISPREIAFSIKKGLFFCTLQLNENPQIVTAEASFTLPTQYYINHLTAWQIRHFSLQQHTVEMAIRETKFFSLSTAQSDRMDSSVLS